MVVDLSSIAVVNATTIIIILHTYISLVWHVMRHIVLRILMSQGFLIPKVMKWRKSIL